MTLEEFLALVEEDDELYVLVRRLIQRLKCEYSVGQFLEEVEKVKARVPEFGNTILWDSIGGRQWNSYKEPLNTVIKRGRNV